MKLTALHVRKLVACPACKANRGEPCRSPYSPHTRVVTHPSRRRRAAEALAARAEIEARRA